MDLEMDGDREPGVLGTWMHQAQVQPAWTRFPSLSPPRPLRGDRAVTAGGAAKAGREPLEPRGGCSETPNQPQGHGAAGGAGGGRTAWPWVG